MYVLQDEKHFMAHPYRFICSSTNALATYSTYFPHYMGVRQRLDFKYYILHASPHTQSVVTVAHPDV